MIVGSARSAGVIDLMIAAVRSTSRSSRLLIWSFIWPMPGIMPSSLEMEPILRTCSICARKSSSVNSFGPLRQLGGHLLGLLLAEGLLGLLDQGEHVAHAEDAGRHAVRVERVEVVQLLAVGGEHDLLAGDLRDGERRTAAGVAVELGEHDAVEADAVAERLGGVDRVLADHRVDDEEDLVGADRVADVGGLLHQLLRRCRGGRRCRR